VEARRELVIAADQCRRRVAVALGLQDLVVLDAAELADRAVDRAYEVGIGERPRAFLQRTREEFVEAAIRSDVADGRLAHVDAVLAHEPSHQARRRRAALARRDVAGERRQAALGHHVLRQDLAAIGHELLSGVGGRREFYRRLLFARRGRRDGAFRILRR
jgi:hypothetical protein